MSNDDNAPKKGVKISNEKSMFNKKEPSVSAQDFEQSADAVFNKFELRKRKCIELGAKFVNILNDKTLAENRSVITKDTEKEVVGGLINIASEINTDESEDEGMGSVAMVTLLMRAVLIQRDKINELSFKVSQLEKLKAKTNAA